MANLEIVVGADIRNAMSGLAKFSGGLASAGAAASVTANQVSGSMSHIGQAIAGISTVDFSEKFREAQQRISASIDKMAADALRMGQQTTSVFGNIPAPLTAAVAAVNQNRQAFSEWAASLVQSGVLAESAFKKLPAAAEKAASGIEGAMKGAISPLQLLHAQLERLQRIASLPGINFRQLERLNGMIASTKAQIGAFERSLDGVNPVMRKVERSAGSANNAVLGFSRIIQDSPYGIMAWANNLEQIPGLMMQVSASAKESGITVRQAMLQSLAGAGGLTLGLSLLTSAMTFASIGFGAYTRGLGGMESSAKKAADKIKEAREALQAYVEALDDVKRSDVLGLQNAQEELVSLQALYAATQNHNVALEDRKKLVNELQAQYPKYFANIKDEVILAGGAQAAYEKLASAITASAKARAAQDTIVDLEKQKLALDVKGAKAAENLLKAEANAARVRQREESRAASNTGNAAALSVQSMLEVNRANQKVIDSQRELNDVAGEYQDIQNRIRKITQSLTSNIEKNGADILIDVDDKLPKPKKEKKDNRQYEFLYEFLPFNPDGKLKPVHRSKLLDAIYKFNDEFGQILVGADFRQLKIDINKDGLVNESDIIIAAKNFWKDLKSGLVKFKPPKIVDDLSFVPKFEESNDKSFLPEPDSNLFISSLREAARKAEGIEFSPFLKFDADKAEILDKYRTLFKQFGKELPKELNFNGNMVDVSLLNDLPKLEAKLNETFTRMREQTFATANAISNTLTPAFQSLFGAILAGESPLKAFFNSLGQSLIQLINQLMAAAIKAAVLSLIVPGAGKVGGIMGKVFSGVGALPFANGGLVFGPTLGLIGEGPGTSRSNPEVIAPLDQLKGFLQGHAANQSPIILTPTLRGQDIVYQVARTQRSINRIS